MTFVTNWILNTKIHVVASGSPNMAVCGDRAVVGVIGRNEASRMGLTTI